ncbi:hypothetical protein [Mycobacterium lacus]|uniref:Uncharacterized protein n=1 Tax=Mycobacterium lacus TaxID=169765 RepID=A0A1X1XLF8_9MYCO|nr:hypothetical protein [Mycobacterium lacus]MCV7123732.1 hypothetical protein [Mycobacterium lacus]ORV99600.1 hypothetical protein AWC15_10095 [Mycobacterium lacus]BBX96066.1 hypothetical protein MLAC_13600 [Mycobacterium lacus]
MTPAPTGPATPTPSLQRRVTLLAVALPAVLLVVLGVRGRWPGRTAASWCVCRTTAAPNSG